MLRDGFGRIHLAPSSPPLQGILGAAELIESGTTDGRHGVDEWIVVLDSQRIVFVY